MKKAISSQLSALSKAESVMEEIDGYPPRSASAVEHRQVLTES